MLHFGSLVASASPLFASVLLLAVPPEMAAVRNYLERYCTIVGLFSLWSLTLLFSLRYVSAGTSAENRRKRNLYLAGIIAGSCSSLFLLNYVKIRFEIEVFYLVIFLLGQVGLSRYLRQNGWIASWCATSFLFDFGLAYLSFQMTFFRFSWQIALFSAAIASVLLAVRASLVLRPPDGTTPPRWLVHTFSISLFMGPLLIGLLIFCAQMHSYYFSTFLLLPCITRLPPLARTAPSPSATAEDSLVRETLLNAILFFTLILGTSLFLVR